MTKIDCLIEVAKKLREARSLAERSSDRALLYFIDMTLAHVCDSLDARSESKGAEDKQASSSKPLRERSEALRLQPRTDLCDPPGLVPGAFANCRHGR